MIDIHDYKYIHNKIIGLSSRRRLGLANDNDDDGAEDDNDGGLFVFWFQLSGDGLLGHAGGHGFGSSAPRLAGTMLDDGRSVLWAHGLFWLALPCRGFGIFSQEGGLYPSSPFLEASRGFPVESNM